MFPPCNITSVGHIHFRKKENIQKKNINELVTHSKKEIKGLYRGIHEFEDYQAKTNLVKGENGNLLVDSDNIKWVEELLL
jgi:hypothetical protein